MASQPYPSGGAFANWNPTIPSGDGSKERADLFEVGAEDLDENVKGSNPQTEFHREGKPAGPFGARGHGF